MQFVHDGTMLAGGGTEIGGITAMEVLQLNGQVVLYAYAAQTNGNLSGLQTITDADDSFILSDPGGTAHGDSIVQGSSVNLTCVSLDGTMKLLMSGGPTDDISSYGFQSGGSLAQNDMLGVNQGDGTAVRALTHLELNGDDFIFASHYGGDGVYAYRQGDTGEMQNTAQSGHGGSLVAGGGEVVALAVVSIDSDDYLVSASRSGNAVTLWAPDADGNLTERSTIGVDQGLGINEPTGLVTAIVDGQPYVLLASADSSSLSVLSVGAGGSLTAVDHVIDSQLTRFQSISEITTVAVGEQTFIFVAGADDGVSVFSLLPGGRLLHRGSIEDAEGLSLDNVSAMSASETDGEITLFVSSNTEAGITRFKLNTDADGVVETGTDQNDNVVGTNLGDILAGGAGEDFINGAAGDDVLIDGGGVDQMRGGGGSDVFVFEADGSIDTVLDFNVAQDRLDMSGLGQLYHISQIEIIPTADGAMLIFGDETIVLKSHNGESLTEMSFSNANLLDAQHIPVGNVAADQFLSGTNSDDYLQGGMGDDVLDGGRGADTFDGGDGFDVVSYGSSSRSVILMLNKPENSRNDAEGDTFTGIEAFEGSDNRDRMVGDGEDNYFTGGRGGDTLRGAGGDDALYGGKGNDRLEGDLGADLLSGGDDHHIDLFRYASAQHSTTGVGNRDVIIDFDQGTDKVDLRPMDADTTQNRNQAFEFIGNAEFTGTAGELRYEYNNTRTLVQADIDGDGSADLEIELRGIDDMTVGDFML